MEQTRGGGGGDHAGEETAAGAVGAGGTRYAVPAGHGRGVAVAQHLTAVAAVAVVQAQSESTRAAQLMVDGLVMEHSARGCQKRKTHVMLHKPERELEVAATQRRRAMASSAPALQRMCQAASLQETIAVQRQILL
jgi:hypothetical protein